MSVPRKFKCDVISVTDHGEHVYTLDLRPHQPVPHFRPGQFLHLTVDPYDPAGFWPESRVFSIASSPDQRDLLRICYSVKGRYTSRMEREIKPGRSLWAKMPYGDFVVDAAGLVVLLAGGTGITAFTAFLAGLKPDDPRKVQLVYGARSPELLIFHQDILAWARRVANLQVLFLVEQHEPGFGLNSGSLTYMSGRVNVDGVWASLGNPAETDYYLSGPPGMIKALSGELASRGVKAPRIHVDAWE